MITDTHMHVIPDVDDGALDMDMALEMFKMSYDQGVRNIFCTSHDSAYDWDMEKPYNNFELLKKRAEEIYPDLKLYLGCEIFCIPRYMPVLVKGINDKRYPTMNGTKYVLTEYPTRRFTFEEILYCVKALEENGNKIIIAHSERYADYLTLENIRELKQRGCLIQINAYSLVEEKDEDIKKLANLILENELVDFIGTDAHRSNRRAPDIKSGIELINEKCSGAYRANILYKNAQSMLISGESIYKSGS